MYKILTLNNISPVGLEHLPRDAYEVASEIQHPDAILLRSRNMHDMEIPPTVKAIGRAGAGVNNIPVDAMSRRGVPVFNAPGANANAVKELVIAGMLMAARNLTEGWNFARALEGTDEEIHSKVESGKKQFVGFELPGKTLGVVGLGAIGVQVANGALALGMNVIGFDPEITVQRAWEMSSNVRKASSVEELLMAADFVTFHVPLVDATRDMINEERLKLARDNVIILNFSRNGVVNDEAVMAAIDAGKVYAYVCDFPGNLLKDHPRVITLPHLGASTQQAEDNCAVMVAEQVKDFLESGNVRNSVNFPEMFMPRNGEFRLAVVNENIPNMLGQISTCIAEAGLNILDMLNKSKGDLAYTLVDVDSKVPPACLEQIAKIDGVLAVRAL
ncbi:MAG: phosphoglycerate dehydrogenase [Gammaproteobacteria bacterium]|nr:phosphoglycerate dehydrogenase [Gammaproteobacteria bacterium]MDH3559861.1 phosphoglycerate dehydrogenase [Gammaproteobacteria bacterium]